MQSRRELLQLTLALPLIARATSARVQIISERNCLSEESALGFDSIVQEHAQFFAALRRPIIIAAGVTRFSQRHLEQLRARVEQGACLIWECSAYGNRPKEVFGLRTDRTPLLGDEMYVHYRWPAEATVRRFDRFTRIACLPGEAIAHVADQPVAAVRQIGKGTLIFLGSMLGPHLRAGDRDARELTRKMLGVRS